MKRDAHEILKDKSMSDKTSFVPLVSFCLRSHNQKDFFQEALEGAFAQDYSPLEICIYDDCSTDGSDEIIRRMIDEYRKTDGRHSIVYEHGEKNIRK